MDIQIINKSVFVDGNKATKKRLPKWSHSREVYYTENYIIKVSFTGCDYEEEFCQTLSEFSLYKRLDNEDKIFFAKPIRISKRFKYGVYERIFPSNHCRDGAYDLVRSLCDKYGLYDIYGREDNWVMVSENTPKILDYGYQH